ncbi:hypothetical protein PCC7424_4733 [Gloeothece citriformis PCC 7424]|uniref:PEP-CTERM protein-sorting domain-containing protein n=1 Tax=Gloeothece citriformis (strain PCC 7424) TaxID=65393 RepID=B7KCX2_GLOC7|nr:PEP-CTERM sorting domain-containing protein [Gloeothece citriformis]ACK73093.1 hypothetical protein PCC7424_4733 [Gloeothece citriformis PCC 7424]
MNTKFLPIGLQIATVGATVLAVSPSQAAIVSWSIQGGFVNQPMTTLGLNIINPPPQSIDLSVGFQEIQPDGTIKPILNPDPNRDIFGIIEKQSVALTKDLPVLSAFSQTKTNLQIPKETLVSSYLFYLNPPGSTGRGSPRYRWVGEIVFDAPVLGIIAGYGKFTHTLANSLVGLDNISYNIRTSPDPGQDFVNFSGNVLTFDLNSRGGREPFRVIIDGTPKAAQGVPEPFTLLGSLSALGFGTWFRKARSKGNSKGKNKQHD